MMNILVVDDDMVQIETSRRGLRSKGNQVFDALSAEDVLNHFNHSNMNKIDLVFLKNFVQALEKG